MEPRFELRCLGDPVLLASDGQPVKIRVRKHLALLIYLAVERGTRHRREHLADLLWPNLSENDGKHSVATAVTAIRSAFGGDVLDTSREGLLWAFTGIRLDLDRLSAGDILGDESGHGMLHVAPFLEGLEIPGAVEFMLWRERQRASWLPRIRDALVVLMDRCRRTGDSRQIELMADRLLALDDLSEDAIRAKMEARAFAGDRLSALRIFESWKDRLNDELGAQPGPLVEGMAVRLRKRGWERSSHPAVAAVRTEQWQDRPFIGRGAEYRLLYEAWERTQKLEEGHALVLGESGIGKSTLVERLSTAAGLEGASVSRVQCYELEREIPFAALGGLVHGLLDRPGASATSPEALSELSRAVPEIRKRYPNVAVPQATEGETARYRIAESLHELVTCVADEHPLILVVDDHHLADDASLALIHILLRRLDRQPVMLILVARPGEPGSSPHAVRLKENLSKFSTVTVELPPLTAEESEQLVTALLANEARQPSVSVRRALVRSGRGYPMVMELLCQDWVRHGEQSLALTMDAMTQEPGVSGAPIEVIGPLYDRLVSALDPPTLNVLNLCSILGHRLNDASMYSLVDLSIGQTLSGCSQLTKLRVLRDSSAGLEFTNELIRAHAYLQIPSTMRRTLHAKIAERLIEQERDGEDIGGLEIAWHCYRAGKPEEATPYLLSGARRAMDRGAPLDADRALTSALPGLSGQSHNTALLLLAEVKRETGNAHDSLLLLEQHDDSIDLCETEWAEVLRADAEYRLGQNSYLDQESVRGRLRHLSASGSTEQTRVRAFMVLANCAYRKRDCDEAVELIASACSHAPPQLPPSALEHSWALALLYAMRGKFDTSSQILGAAVLRAGSCGVRNTAFVHASIGLGAILSAEGQPAQALQRFEVAYNLARALDNRPMMLRAAANCALSSRLLGNWADTMTWGETAAQLRSSVLEGHAEVMNACVTSVAYAAVGRGSEAFELLKTTRNRVNSDQPTWYLQILELGEADVLWMLKKTSAAIRLAATSLARMKGAPAISYAGAYARWNALTVGRYFDPETAESRVRPLLERLDTLDFPDQAEVLCALHRIHAAGNHRQADDDLGSWLAIQVSERLSKIHPCFARELRRFRLL